MILKKLKKFFICLSAILIPLLSAAQTEKNRVDAGEKRVEDALEQYYKQHPQEKIYLHTNQNVYLSGQTIWYKAYALSYGKPSQLSKILYVRLSGDKGKFIIQDKLPLDKGGAHGNIKIPDSLRTGWYHIQGFTLWMLNDKRDVYSADVYIQNHTDAQITPAVLATNNKLTNRIHGNEYKFNSYAFTREFPVVDYSNPKLTDHPDYRTTLYWNHDLEPDAQGNVKIRFYNSDKAKGYRVIVQGMDADGKTGYLVKEY